MDQIWAWLPRGHRLAVGVRDPLKSSVTGPSLLVNCYLEIKFHKKIPIGPPPPLNDKVQIQSGDFGKFMPSSQANSMFLNECSEDEVNTIIRELQNGKSSDIPIGVIKKTSKIISPILSSHFNYLMKVGKFPDTIDHKILINKLNHYGVRGNTLSLIESYLSNRKQCVSALGEISEQLAVIFGVPQGSCLGPLLFLIYINDISNICKSNELILFADDTNIFVKGKSKQEVYIEANMILKQLSIYTMLNKLHVNLEKSCFMYFTKTSSNDENDNENDNIPPIMIGATEIKRVSEIKFLGVVIDEKLSWDAHVKSLTKKLASCTGSINRIAASIPKTLYMNLYYTLFESYITYGITVWCSIPNRKFNKLFNAQKKILRVLFGDREKFLDKFRTCIRARPYPEQNLPTEFYVKEHSKPLFNKNKILNLKNLYLYHCANETFEILKFRSPIVIHNLYKFSTRGQRNLFIITPPPDNTFIYKSSVIWNSVKSIFKIDDPATSVSILKLKLKTYLLNKQLLGDAENWVENNFIQL